jgi:hypothetical protein
MSTGCYCMGPQNGEPECPCRMRAKRIVGDGDWRPVSVAVGWKCPVCGKGNAPFMPTCGNTLCGVNLNSPACASDNTGANHE